MCLTGGAVTAQAPAGQAAAGRVAPTLTVATATIPHHGAAWTPIPHTSGHVQLRNPTNQQTTAGMEPLVWLFKTSRQTNI